MPSAIINAPHLSKKTNKPLRIIAVDDEEDALANLRDVLQLLGHEVDIACNSRDALRLAREKNYDVALLDFRMPEMNGIDLAKQIKKICPCITMMLITAYLNAEQESGVSDERQFRKVLSKPLDINRLASILGEVRGEISVLIVDDDRDLCSNLREAYEHAGYRVCLAHDYQEAEKMIELSGFNIAIIDFRLPGGNGSELANRIRRDTPEKPVIIMTGFRNELSDANPVNLSTVCFKPFDIAKLLETTRDVQSSADSGTH